MKNLLLSFLFLIFFLNSKAQTSVYHPFPDSGIVWREQTTGVGQTNCCCSGSICINEEQYENFIDGDTIINSILYKKIYRTGSHNTYAFGFVQCSSSCNGNSELSYFYRELVGGMRQDTIGHKVYIIYPSSMTEYLLYDFNLNLGDTLPVTINNPYKANYVSGIDSILIVKNYNKRYWISQYGSQNFVSLIEGIGSTYGLYWDIVPPFEFQTTLNCVIINSSTVYPDTTTTCDLVDAVNNLPAKNLSLSIYPNPVHDVMTISTNGVIVIPIHREKQSPALIIYNIMGEKVSQSKITNPKTEIDVSSFAEGVYVVQVIDGDKVYRSKFIKQ